MPISCENENIFSTFAAYRLFCIFATLKILNYDSKYRWKGI